MDNINGIPFLSESDSTDSFLSNLLPPSSSPPTFPVSDSINDYNSPFEGDCDGTCEHVAEFHGQNIDFKRLASDMSRSGFFEKKFNAKNYDSGPISAGVSSFGVPVYSNRPSSSGIEYTNSLGKKLKATFRGRLNRVECCVVNLLNLGIIIDEGKVTYRAQWYYKGGEGHIHYFSDGKYDIDDEYVAIEVTTDDYDHLIAFVNASNSQFRGQLEEQIKQYNKFVIAEFSEAFKQSKDDVKTLKYLYEHAPGFAISAMEADRLWEDFIAFLKYDDEGTFSGWRDASSAAVKILINFPSADYLFEQFNKNQKLLKRIYADLDGTQKIDGQEFTNKDLFCIFLSAISSLNKNAVYTNKTFIIGEGYAVDSNIFPGNDKEEGKILLKQQKVITHTVPDITIDEFGVQETIGTKQIGVLTGVDEGQYFNPLDMVILKDSLTGEEQYVPALYVKLLADNAEWEKVKVFAAATILVISIIISGGTILAGVTGTAGAGAVAFAVIDIAVSVLDLRAIALRNVDEEKNWFDRNWDQISMGVGIATMSPILAKGILKNGPKLINAISNIGEKQIAVKNFIRSAVAAAILNIEITNFTKGSLKILDRGYDVYKSSLSVLKINKIEKLQKAGMIFAEGQAVVNGEAKKHFVAIYKGEVLVSGDAKTLRYSLDDVFSAQGLKAVTSALDNFYDTVGLIKLGRSRLGNIALNLRRTLPSKYHPGNIAVFEYVKNGKRETKAFTTLSEEELIASGYTNFKPHAEEIGMDWLEKQGLEDVSAVYSELEPCGLKKHRCKAKITAKFPNAKVSYSYIYNNRAEVMSKAIAERAKDLKTILK